MRASHLVIVASLMCIPLVQAAEQNGTTAADLRPVFSPSDFKGGSLVLNVSFDQNGRAVKCEVVSSTVSEASIETIEKFILSNWNHAPYANRVVTVPFEFRFDPFPRPPYPKFARSSHFEGTVLVKVKFDDEGKVASCEVVHSSAEAPLEDYTRGFIKAHWHDKKFAGKTETVPIVYKLN